MRIIQLYKPRLHKLKKPVVAIGIFDGVHRGHQQLIIKTIREAKKIGGTSVVMTFWPHPEQVLRPQHKLSLLVSLPYRLKLLESLGVDVCFVIPFTRSFSRLSPEEFVQRYLVGVINPVEVFVGYDFRFGQNRTGDIQVFQEIGERYGFRVNMVQAVKINKQIISSTNLRQLIMDGQLDKARRFLGRPVSVWGIVRKGHGRGKNLGFPTANINLDNEVIPPRGVYAVRVEMAGKKFLGMANIGCRPSFNRLNRDINIEVHIFDFKKEIYQKAIIIEFIKKIRNERFFHSQDELIRQLNQDETHARRFLANSSSSS